MQCTDLRPRLISVTGRHRRQHQCQGARLPQCRRPGRDARRLRFAPGMPVHKTLSFSPRQRAAGREAGAVRAGPGRARQGRPSGRYISSMTQAAKALGQYRLLALRLSHLFPECALGRFAAPPGRPCPSLPCPSPLRDSAIAISNFFSVQIPIPLARPALAGQTASVGYWFRYCCACRGRQGRQGRHAEDDSAQPPARAAPANGYWQYGHLAMQERRIQF